MMLVYDIGMLALRHYRRIAWLLTALLLWVSAWTTQAADPGAAPNAGEEPVRIFKGARSKAAIITIDREIDNVIFSSIKRRVDEARKEHCDVIVFDISAGGGYMDSAFDSADYLRKLKDELATVAYVHDTAMNTAAILAYACQYIVVSPQASLGNIPPGGGVNAARQAELSGPILADMKKSCDLYGRNFLFAQAMIKPEIEIHEMRSDAELRYVDDAGRKELLKLTRKNAEGKEVDVWQYVRTIDDKNDYLNIHPGKMAVDMGVAGTVIEGDADLFSALRTTQQPVRLDLSFWEKAVLWLTTWPVRGTLFVLMMILAWIEFSHPGISIAGIGAAVCLALLVGAPFLTGLAQAWEIVLIALGVLIVALDLALFGGIGMLAVPGFILMAIGLIASFVPSEPGSGWTPTPQQVAGLQTGFSVVIFGSCIALASFFLMARYLYMTPGFRKIQLAPPKPAAVESVVRDPAEQRVSDAVFVGALGKAASDLRPAGQVRFGAHVIDVITQGQFIGAGEVVEVAEIRGNTVTVRPAKRSSS